MQKFLALSFFAAALFTVHTDFARAQTTNYTYDAQGRLIVAASDAANDATYVYDDAGNIEQIIIAQGGVNHDPVCNDFSTSTPTSSITVTVLPNLCSDEDVGDILSVTNVVQPQNGTTAIIINSNTIIMNNLPSGDITTVEYTVSDDHGGTDVRVLVVFMSGGGFPY